VTTELLALLDTGKHCSTVTLSAQNALAVAEELRAAHADQQSIDQMIDSYREDIETRDGIIRRLLDGWEPVRERGEQRWFSSRQGNAREPMFDAERAVLAALDNEEGATDG
jgi:hypothetical protein